MGKPIRTLLIILFYLSPLVILAQTPLYNITGIIKDKKTGEPLIGASIAVIDLEISKGTITNEEGKFILQEVPQGKHVVQIGYIGYAAETMELMVKKDLHMNVKLEPMQTELDEIVISEKAAPDNEPLNNMAVISARSFTVDQTERFAASIRDPARLALSFAGVKGQADIVNGIIVRGNAPKGVMWRVEGIDVPDPNHFSQEGYGGGAVCMISGEVIGTSDFFAGAFPAEYGNAMSAVFDIRLRKGRTDKRHFFLSAGMLGLEAGMEGPFSDNGRASYILNYRYSTLAVFAKAGFNTGNTVSAYQDLNFKLNMPSKKAGTFSIFGIGGMSKLTIDEERSHKSVDKIKTYDMGVAGISHTISVNEKNLLKTTLSLAANRESLDKDETYYVWNTRLPDYRMNASNLQVREALQLDTRFSARSSLRSGVSFTNTRFRLDDSFDLSSTTDEFKSSGFTYLLQAHSQWKYNLTEKWTLLSGLHFLYFGLNKHYSIEPRAALQWQVHPKHSLQLSAGLHSRLESLALYMVRNPWNQTQPNFDLDFTKAVHIVTGYEFLPLKHIRLKTELFFQHLYDVPISTDEGSSFSILNFLERYTVSKLQNGGKGMNYGIELTMEKSFHKNYYVLANGSIFNSKYFAADGVWRNTRFNSNFVTSISAGKDFPFGKVTKTWIFGLNARVLWSGGERKAETLYEEQYANYFRLDTRVSIARQRLRMHWQFSIDMQNTTNRFNETSLEDIDPVGILPVASFKVSF